jgi:ribosomal protein S18 acetylase RimI-like enzyme
LLAAAETEARRNGVRALHLLVAPGNRVAEELYRAAGFVASPRVMMTKPLDHEPGA